MCMYHLCARERTSPASPFPGIVFRGHVDRDMSMSCQMSMSETKADMSTPWRSAVAGRRSAVAGRSGHCHVDMSPGPAAGHVKDRQQVV